MPKIKSNSALKSILVLAAIALCSGLLLGLFRIITYVDPLTTTYQKFAEDTGASFSQMADEAGAAYGDGEVVYYAVSDDGQWHAFLAEGKGGYGGSVQVYVYIRGGVLEKLVIGDNGETFLSNLEAEGFYDQFVGKEVSSLDVMGTDLVSGATKSSTAVRNGVNAAVEYYTEHASGGEA